MGCGGGGAGNDKGPGVNNAETFSAETFSVGGLVSGLGTGATLVLLNNGGDSLTIVANGNFRFATGISNNSSYTVIVGTQPTDQTCNVSNATGINTTANISNVNVLCHTLIASVSTLAGSGISGRNDGLGAAARFNYPIGVAVDSNGNVYVADTSNHNLRKISAGGVVITFAGYSRSGSDDGIGSQAGFNLPSGVAVDVNGNVYVADTNNYKIRKITSSGVVTTLAGSVVGNSDGMGSSASFNWPSSVAVDSNGNVFVADSRNEKIRKITPSGSVTTVAGSGAIGSTDGTSAASSFSGPAGVAVDSNGSVYVADTDNNKIRKIIFQ